MRARFAQNYAYSVSYVRGRLHEIVANLKQISEKSMQIPFFYFRTLGRGSPEQCPRVLLIEISGKAVRFSDHHDRDDKDTHIIAHHMSSCGDVLPQFMPISFFRCVSEVFQEECKAILSRFTGVHLVFDGFHTRKWCTSDLPCSHKKMLLLIWTPTFACTPPSPPEPGSLAKKDISAQVAKCPLLPSAPACDAWRPYGFAGITAKSRKSTPPIGICLHETESHESVVRVTATFYCSCLPLVRKALSMKSSLGVELLTNFGAPFLRKFLFFCVPPPLQNALPHLGTSRLPFLWETENSEVPEREGLEEGDFLGEGQTPPGFSMSNEIPAWTCCQRNTLWKQARRTGSLRYLFGQEEVKTDQPLHVLFVLISAFVEDWRMPTLVVRAALRCMLWVPLWDPSRVNFAVTCSLLTCLASLLQVLWRNKTTSPSKS